MKWINFEENTVYWPKGNYKKPMSQMVDAHPKVFNAFEPVKIQPFWLLICEVAFNIVLYNFQSL